MLKIMINITKFAILKKPKCGKKETKRKKDKEKRERVRNSIK